MTGWLPYLIVCPLCGLASFIDAIAGGGGLISLPAYYLAGLPPQLAAGTNKLSASIGTTAALGWFWRHRKIAWLPALCAVLGAFPGATLGASLLQRMDEAMILRMMLAVLPVAALFLLLRREGLAAASRIPLAAVGPICFLIGLIIGFYDGLIGPGTGTFLILLFTFVTGMEAVTASGTAKAVNLASNFASLVTFALNAQVLWPLGLAAAAFSLIGSTLGARFAIRQGAKAIRLVMLAVFVLLMASMAQRLIAGM